MGVHGLTSYILGNSTKYLNPYQLSDCCVVIDGTNMAHFLAFELKSHSAFGGDYDEYFTRVRSFMLALKKCNIYPIVLMDGGCEKTKLKTRLNRRHCTAQKLRSFSEGFSAENFFPLFIIHVFINAVRDIGFICIQCDLEADGEIAAVARSLNCPVLSSDSDYFIYNVLYIPFKTVKQTPVKYPHSIKYYIQCSIYNVDDFLKTTNLDKPLLPILATLLGNDYVESTVFNKFFNHVSMPKCKNKSRSQRRIHGIFQWLKSENLNSAVNHILSHLEKSKAEEVKKLFNRTVNSYSIPTVCEAVLNELKSKFTDIQLFKHDFSLCWPEEIAKLYSQTAINGFIINIILYQFYLTPLQVENIYDQSSHFRCLNLIRKIYAMLLPYLRNKKPLQLYLMVNKQYTRIEINTDLSDIIYLDKVLKEPQEARLQLLCDIVGIPMDDLKFVPCNHWAIFIMSFIYWVKEFNNSVTLAHIHAFVIMIIANQVVQPKVGYFRNSPDFIKRHGEKLAKLRDTELILKESSNFKEMLVNVNFFECLLVQRDLIPLRRTTVEGSSREYCISTIHLFNCFQSCLFHILQINSLLNLPLPYLKIHEFYSGTLLFNLYVSIKSKSSVEKFGSSLFLQTPNLNKIYNYLCEKLSKFSEKTEVKGRVPRRKRNKKHKSPSVKVIEYIHRSTDDESEFIDENNSFALLNKIKDL